MYAATVTKEKLFESIGSDRIYERVLVGDSKKTLVYVATPFSATPAQFRIVIQEINGEVTHTICYNIDEAIKEYNDTLR